MDPLGCAGRGAVSARDLRAWLEKSLPRAALAPSPAGHGREGAVLAAVAGDALRGRVRRADLAPRIMAGRGWTSGCGRSSVRSAILAGAPEAAQHHRGGLRRPDHRPLRVGRPRNGGSCGPILNRRGDSGASSSPNPRRDPTSRRCAPRPTRVHRRLGGSRGQKIWTSRGANLAPTPSCSPPPPAGAPVTRGSPTSCCRWAARASRSGRSPTCSARQSSNEVFLDDVFLSDDAVVWRGRRGLGRCYGHPRLRTGRHRDRQGEHHQSRRRPRRRDPAHDGRRRGHPLGADPARSRQRVADLWARALVHHTISPAGDLRRGWPPGRPARSPRSASCTSARWSRTLADFRLSLEPLAGQFGLDDNLPRRPPRAPPVAPPSQPGTRYGDRRRLDVHPAQHRRRNASSGMPRGMT